MSIKGTTAAVPVRRAIHSRMRAPVVPRPRKSGMFTKPPSRALEILGTVTHGALNDSRSALGTHRPANVTQDEQRGVKEGLPVLILFRTGQGELAGAQSGWQD